MESQPQNPEIKNNPENFHPWTFETSVDPDEVPQNTAIDQGLHSLLI